MTHKEQYPFVTVGALILADDGQALFVRSHKWNQLWTVPGGKVDKGEIRKDAIIREVLEETALCVEHPELLLTIDCINSSEFWQKECHFVMNDYIVFLSKNTRKEDVCLNEEAEEFCWLDPQKALDLPLTNETILLIESYLERCQKGKKI